MARTKRSKSTPVFGSRTDIGCVREQNEDSLVVVPPLYAICDGMGGHAAGEVASEIAINVISQRAPSIPDAGALGQAVEEANLAVIKAAQEGQGRAGMGTTCTAAVLVDEKLVIAQVGDSRAYLFNQGSLQQITRDHSLVADLVESGQLTPQEARVHPERSIITRALGSDPHMKPDLYELDVKVGDKLLLCSDGLTSMVEDDKIEDILRHTEDPQLAASKLVNAAIDAGGHDNVTAIVVNVSGLAEKQHKKVARRTKITAVVIIVFLVAILFGAGYAFYYWTTNSAYLGEQNGKVAVYQGVPDEILGMSFSTLVEVTDVSVDDLQPGVASRIEKEEIRTDSLQDAQDLVEAYRTEIAASKTAQTESADNASNDAADTTDSTNKSDSGSNAESNNSQNSGSSNSTDNSQNSSSAGSSANDSTNSGVGA